MRIWVVALAVMLAGCSEGGKPSGPESPTETPPVVRVSEAGFDLKVVVVNDTISPIGGANITIAAIGLSATTNHAGEVVLEGLPAGTYLMEASALGYLNTTTFVDLEKDQTHRILLDRDPGFIEARFVPMYLKGFITGRESGFRRSSGTDVFFGDCECVMTRDAEPGLTGFAVDVIWKDTINKPVGDPRKFRWLITTDETFDWEIRRGPSPWTEHVDATLFNSWESTEWWEIMIYADNDWITYDQDFEAFWTSFHAMDVPDGFTMIPPE